MTRAGAFLLAAALLAGCTTHAGPRRLLKPEGETVTIEIAEDRTLTGELLGIAGERLILLRDERLLALPLGSFSSLEVDGYPALKSSDREKLRLHARYPQWLSDEQWRQVLLERGQQDFDRLPAR